MPGSIHVTISFLAARLKAERPARRKDRRRAASRLPNAASLPNAGMYTADRLRSGKRLSVEHTESTRNRQYVVWSPVLAVQRSSRFDHSTNKGRAAALGLSLSPGSWWHHDSWHNPSRGIRAWARLQRLRQSTEGPKGGDRVWHNVHESVSQHEHPDYLTPRPWRRPRRLVLQHPSQPR